VRQQMTLLKSAASVFPFIRPEAVRKIKPERVVLDLDLNSGRLACLGVANIYVAGSLKEKLMECRFEQT
jgi:hypothetical protein